ncbi:hypothetical protein Sjap_005101 [Stephania japonica]|uniref:Uncharacterized protein n=1 Tax=Stephania japonica TaxID=461633 RepID=A0AAP0K3F5_9MAGN
MADTSSRALVLSDKGLLPTVLCFVHFVCSMILSRNSMQSTQTVFTRAFVFFSPK